jgi:hypothetical protein
MLGKRDSTSYKLMNLASKFAALLIWLLGFGLALKSEAQAQPDVVVSFVTTNSTPLNPGFSGFNITADNAVEYYDTNFQQIVTTLSPGGALLKNPI